MWRGGEGKEEYVGKRVMRMDVEGRRRKGRICGEKSDEDGCGGEEKERKYMWGKSDEDGCRGAKKERKYMWGKE